MVSFLQQDTANRTQDSIGVIKSRNNRENKKCEVTGGNHTVSGNTTHAFIHPATFLLLKIASELPIRIVLTIYFLELSDI